MVPVGVFGVFSDSKKGLTKLAQPFLEPGEQLEHVVFAYRHWLDTQIVLAVTDRAIIVIEVWMGRLGVLRAARRRPVCRLPRRTRLGPVSPKGYIWMDGEPLAVRAAREEIAQIDMEGGFRAASTSYGSFSRGMSG